MPELPEVETVKRGLVKLLVGHTIKSVDFDWPKSFPNAENDVEQFLIRSKVIDVRRRAKVLMIDLSSNYSLVIHLKMTGQLVYVRLGEQSDESRMMSQEKDNQTTSHNSVSVADTRFGAGHPNDSLIKKLPDNSTRVVFTLDNNANLYFNDQRKFGWVKLLPTNHIQEMPFMQKVGPEPLEDEFTYLVFVSRLHRRKNSAIKAVLAKVGDISQAKLKKLYEEIRYVLNLSIEKGGSTDRNYVNAEGKKGSYIDFARVFRKEGTPCQRCGTTITKTRVASRGTHLCMVCQRYNNLPLNQSRPDYLPHSTDERKLVQNS